MISTNVDAIVPLLFATTAFGLHYPILDRLTAAVRLYLKNGQSAHEIKAASEAQRFYSLLERVKYKLSKPFLRPLFPVDQELRQTNESQAWVYHGEELAEERVTDEKGDRSYTQYDLDIESLAVVFRLAGDEVVVLENTLRRLKEVFKVGSSEVINGGDRAELGPRDL